MRLAVFNRVVPRFVARVARGGHDQHLRFVKVRCVYRRPPTAHSRLLGGLRASRSCVEPPCAVGLYVRGGPPKTWYLVSSNMLRAFALSSAASSVRKPPDSERCTTCRRVVDGRLKKAHTRRGHRPESGQGFRGRYPGLAGARRSLWAVEPLSHSPRWREPSGATVADSVCSLSRYAACFGVRCAVGQHPPAATRAGRPLWRASTRPLGVRVWYTVGGDGGGGGGGRRKCGGGRTRGLP